VIEGTLTHAGAGLAGVRVLVDGEPRGATDGAGSFRVRGVTAGSHRVSLDLRTLEPGLELNGSAEQEVTVQPAGPARVAFTVERFSSLQGALVACEGTQRTGLAGVDVMLRAGTVEQRARTSHLGGFHFGRLRPGIYELTVLRAETGETLLDPVRVDLGRDVFGYVIELGCE
jgi:hypothetical protein